MYVAGQLKQLVQIFASASSHRRRTPPVFQRSPRLTSGIAKTTAAPPQPAASPVDDVDSIPKSARGVCLGTLVRASSIGEGSETSQTRGSKCANMRPSQRAIDRFVVSQLEQLSQLLDVPQAVASEVTGGRGGGGGDGDGDWGGGDVGSPHASSDWCYSQSTSCSESSPTFSHISPSKFAPPLLVAPPTPRLSGNSGTGVVVASAMPPSPSAPFVDVALTPTKVIESPGNRGSFGSGVEMLFSPVNVGSDDERGKGGEDKTPGTCLPPSAAVEYDVESDEEIKRGEVMAVDLAGARNPRFSGVVGRARLWRQMLDIESRAASMLQNIVAENAGVLDQGVVLPCAPSDEEKVQSFVPYLDDKGE